MQPKISKTLDAILARAAFNAAKSGTTHSFKDLVMLELLDEEGSIACNFLAGRLKDWELYQVRLRIESEAAAVPDHAAGEGARQAAATDEVEHAFRAFREQLRAAERDGADITTLHALRELMADRSTATARTLEMYGLTDAAVAERIVGAASGEEADEASRPQAHDTFDAPGTLRLSEPQPTLERFGTDLTREAREGKIDPVVGREAEIERVIQILSRRKKNNPVLVGEAGVGKSAIVEGLALRIASGKVPHTIAGKRIFSLDVSSLVAGTKFRGEFEERMQQLIEALRRAHDTILFIDELHTIVGAGSTQGSLDTANILKPALARGELQTIGATTVDEYRTSIEADPALERRFQRVRVEPATAEQTLRILHNIAPRYERHHHVRYTEEALKACVALTERYLTDRHFPDKAIDVLDEAGSLGHLDAAREPDDLRRMEEALCAARRERREAVGALVYDEAATARLREIALRAQVSERRAEWQRSLELNPARITEEQIRRVIAAMTGIPAERVTRSELMRLRTLRDHLAGRVIGQEEAVDRIVRTIRRSRAGLAEGSRPVGVFLFVGPTGVGKTLLAKEISKWLFDERQGLIRIDMSEYAERHSIARLIGAPPGYVGYGEGGQLTEAVRQHPYSVVLLDEIEKAHPEVFNTMLQLFDEGRLTDGSGRCVDFRNTIVIMTSNVGSQETVRKAPQVGFGTASKETAAATAEEETYRRALEETFSPEFLNRIDDIVLFRSLELGDVERIVELELKGLRSRTERLGLTLRITDAARHTLAALGYERRYGARALRRTLLDRVEEPLSALIIDGKLRTGDTVIVESQSDEGVTLRVA